MVQKEFKVNEYITLKLERNNTNIYVDGELFQQCKYLAFNIPLESIQEFDEIKSIDEMEEIDRSSTYNTLDIRPEEEFWGHCSNIVRRRKLYNIFSKEPRIQTASGNHADSNPKGLGSKACMVMY